MFKTALASYCLTQNLLVEFDRKDSNFSQVTDSNLEFSQQNKQPIISKHHYLSAGSVFISLSSIMKFLTILLTSHNFKCLQTINLFVYPFQQFLYYFMKLLKFELKLLF